MVKDVSIVIVSWNVVDLVEANLERLFSLGCAERLEVFVVDNASEDGTAAMVRERFPQVRLIQNDWDAGFAGPNNQALRLATGKVLILLNPDMLVGEGAIEHTVETLLNDTTIGVMGVRLNNENGEPIGSVRRFPTFGSQLAILLKVAKLFPRMTRHYMAEDFDYTTSQNVDQVRGSFFAFRRELLSTVGYLDDAYHIWFEEVDYCKRAQEAGYRIWYSAQKSCTDLVGRGVAKMTHYEKQRIFTASMVHYFKKWHPWWQWLILAAVRPFGILMAAALDGVNRMKRLWQR